MTSSGSFYLQWKSMLSKPWGGKILPNGSDQKKELQLFSLFSACQLKQVSSLKNSQSREYPRWPPPLPPTRRENLTWEETDFSSILKALKFKTKKKKHTQAKRTMRQSNRVTSRKKTGKSGKMSSNCKHIWKLMPAPNSGQEYFFFQQAINQGSSFSQLWYCPSLSHSSELSPRHSTCQ